jgi:serine protease inhibitor
MGIRLLEDGTMKKQLLVGGLASLFISAPGIFSGCTSDVNAPVAVSPAEAATSKAEVIPVTMPSFNNAPTASPLARGYNEFGFRLLRRLAQDDNGNIVLSPYSIASALAMASNGAAGQTRRELHELLGAAAMQTAAFNKGNQNLRETLQSSDEKTRLNIANSLWVEKSVKFKTPFLNDSKQFFNAPVQNVDMSSNATVQRINDWTKQQTEGKIPQILARLDPKTLMVLMNAVYFKGEWAAKFDAKQTKNAAFHAPGGDKQLPFMTQSGEYWYLQNDSVQMVALPYKNDRFAMWLALPRGAKLDVLLQKTTAQTWQQWTQSAKPMPGTVKLPKMKIAGDQHLEKVLPSLGVPTAFGGAADFSNMTGEAVQIGQVKHKAVIEVDEVGTEAAAATAITMVRGPSPEPFAFTADKPFLMAIQERSSGAIVFLSRVENP